VDVMEEDMDVLDEIEEKKKKKSFQTVINSSRYNKFDLDEVMLEA
jgi:hypothetical protein